jgi:hypothetical protein
VEVLVRAFLDEIKQDSPRESVYGATLPRTTLAR